MFKFLMWLHKNNCLPPFIWATCDTAQTWATFYIDLPFGFSFCVGGDCFCDVFVYDYTNGKIYIYRGAPTMTGEELDDFVSSKGHHLASCDYGVWTKIEVVRERA